MNNRKLVTLAATVLFLTAGQSQAAEMIEDHAEMEGPYATPMEVTKACLECHEEAADQVMATSHWTWEREQDIEGKGIVRRGKKNAINNFCISLKSNWPRCTSCHIGYGWKDASFDFSDSSRIDCLACHDTTGGYFKAKHAPAGSGMVPGYTGNDAFDKNPYDLVKMAQNAGKPTRKTCLNCHANGGGGNNVKHGDIDMSLVKPTPEVDVHLAPKGQNFTCQECHVTEEHSMKGNALLVSPAGGEAVRCVDCHQEKLHNKVRIRGLLNKHAKRIACQTCHIPVFAKQFATKMSWDWSKAKDPKTLPKNRRVVKKDGHAVYVFKKGEFVYQQNVVPSYFWYNGTAKPYLPGDTIDPGQVTDLNRPLGSREDPNAKITPFKVHMGKQPYDSKYNYLAFPKLWGKKGDPDAFWINFDWKRAISAGMKANGLKFSGEYGFAPTASYWPINHQVSPAKKALRCDDCHGAKGRMDWKALGYDMDPKAKLKLKKKS